MLALALLLVPALLVLVLALLVLLLLLVVLLLVLRRRRRRRLLVMLVMLVVLALLLVLLVVVVLPLLLGRRQLAHLDLCCQAAEEAPASASSFCSSSWTGDSAAALRRCSSHTCSIKSRALLQLGAGPPLLCPRRRQLVAALVCRPAQLGQLDNPRLFGCQLLPQAPHLGGELVARVQGRALSLLRQPTRQLCWVMGSVLLHQAGYLVVAPGLNSLTSLPGAGTLGLQLGHARISAQRCMASLLATAADFHLPSSSANRCRARQREVAQVLCSEASWPDPTPVPCPPAQDSSPSPGLRLSGTTCRVVVGRR